jgi:hypothetical protein
MHGRAMSLFLACAQILHMRSIEITPMSRDVKLRDVNEALILLV